MQKLIGVVNKLQDSFAALSLECPFNLPQIAVVGEQSSGKSSVLESFVGKDFLPRGSGIVTRRPLILQLINHKGAEYAEFLHKLNCKLTNFDEVRREIEFETDRLAGKSKAVSGVPINLRIYSPHVLNLTLIDLPGITKVPVGDQPADIERQIRDMVLNHISNSNTLILAVIPAITDLANSEALKIAREVDPARYRTIGVITKIDQMDAGTDCVDALAGRIYPLARGFVGVVNRNQRDIDSRKDITAAQKDEQTFFSRHPKYNIFAGRIGSRHLQNTLNKQLTVHIRETLPRLKTSIMEENLKIQEVIDRDPALFENLNTNETEYQKVLMIMIHDLVKRVDTELGYDCENVDVENLSTGSEISQILFQRFIYEIERIKPLSHKVKAEIKIAILNSQGIRRSIFSPGASFLAVIKSHIKFIEGPCLTVLEIVDGHVREMMQNAVFKIFKAYPALHSEINCFVMDKLSKYSMQAKEFLKMMIEIQIEHINTNHPDFLAAQDTPGGGSSSFSASRQKNVIAGTENFIYKQGYLFVLNSSTLKSNRQIFAVLRGQVLLVYKDASKNEFKEQFILIDCRIKDVTVKGKTFLNIFTKDARSILKNSKNLELMAINGRESEAWKAALVSCGIELDRSDEGVGEQEDMTSNVDQELHKNIEYVFLLFDSYLKIVIKLIQDILSKICVYCIISKLRKTLFTDLVVHMYSRSDVKSLMRESDDTIAQRQRVLYMKKACNDALDVIRNFQNEFGYELASASSMDAEVFPDIPPQDIVRVESETNINRNFSTPGARFRSDNNLNMKSESFADNSPPTDLASGRPEIPEKKKPKRPPPTGGSKFYTKAE